MALKGYKAFKYVNFGISFGSTMAVSLYFGFKGGAWLDNRFGTEPLFAICGLLLGVVVTFKNLFENIKNMDNNKKSEKDK